MYRVELSRKAKRFFERANVDLQRRLDRCFDRLKVEPHEGGNIKLLTGNLAGHYRYRVGDYRVVYRIEEDRLLVLVILIAHRSEAYDKATVTAPAP
jgi:mRNA interferase RelE/StbE